LSAAQEGGEFLRQELLKSTATDLSVDMFVFGTVSPRDVAEAIDSIIHSNQHVHNNKESK
jgi:hypothetical protein